MRAGAVGTLTSVETDEAVEAIVVRQWIEAADALEAVRRTELREMSDAEALAAAEAVLDLVSTLPVRDTLSGLIEQQRLFSLAFR